MTNPSSTTLRQYKITNVDDSEYFEYERADLTNSGPTVPAKSLALTEEIGGDGARRWLVGGAGAPRPARDYPSACLAAADLADAHARDFLGTDYDKDTDLDDPRWDRWRIGNGWAAVARQLRHAAFTGVTVRVTGLGDAASVQQCVTDLDCGDYALSPDLGQGAWRFTRAGREGTVLSGEEVSGVVRQACRIARTQGESIRLRTTGFGADPDTATTRVLGDLQGIAFEIIDNAITRGLTSGKPMSRALSRHLGPAGAASSF